MICVQDYLDRIGYHDEITLDTNTLNKLITSHIYTVPYENLDIIHKKPLSLSINDILEKIVTNNRGGYCFELNFAFAWLLENLGFTVKEYFARFLLGENQIPMPRHRILEVMIDNKPYLCDVGVGIETLRFAMLAEDNHMQSDYKIIFDNSLGVTLWQFYKDEWRKYFSYVKSDTFPIDFLATSYFCEHSPISIFNKEYMVSIKTPTGRKTLDGNIFKIFKDDDVSVTVIDNDTSISRVLSEHFGLHL